MPTYDVTARFWRDFRSLTPDQRAAVLAMVQVFVAGLREQQFDHRLRVKRVQGHDGVWEVTWAADGRATFEYGPEVEPGEPHIIWRRVGSHAIFRQP